MIQSLHEGVHNTPVYLKAVHIKKKCYIMVILAQEIMLIWIG